MCWQSEGVGTYGHAYPCTHAVYGKSLHHSLQNSFLVIYIVLGQSSGAGVAANTAISCGPRPAALLLYIVPTVAIQLILCCFV